MDIVPRKQCSKCGEEKPATLEYFGRKERGTYGVKRTCRLCEGIEQKKRSANPQYLESMRISAQERRRSQPRTEKIRKQERDRARESRIKNPELKRSKARSYYCDYYSTPKGKSVIQANKQRRRARKREAAGTCTGDDIALLHKSQKGLCWWCGKAVESNYHVDHRKPLALGGSNDPSNLCISCPTCNSTKGMKMPWEFNGRLL